MKKNFKKFFSLCTAAVLTVTSMIAGVSAAPVADATIDMSAECSLTMYKYDWTNAHKDGVWNEDSFITTGMKESWVETTLGGETRKGDTDNVSDLGNGGTSNGYAIKGVEYSYLKVADIVTFTESANDGHADYNMTQVLYGFNKTAAADLMTALGLGKGSGRYENADNTDKLNHAENWYYTSDSLNKAISAKLSENSTDLKDALEAYMAAQGGTAMGLTDEKGMTTVKGLPVGLYLVVETKVPEMVTSTTDPFFVSLPMTTVDGNEHSVSHEGGHHWNYDVTLYPKNDTGIPTLEKTVRESKADTGKNNASTVITDGFAHNATGSMGDVMEYQIVTTLPTITSKATSLTAWGYLDTLVAGLDYNKDLKDVKLEIFSDKDCATKAVATWTQTDETPKFTVTYTESDRKMAIDVTEAGLAEINGGAGNVHGSDLNLLRGYSNYTIRVTYSATIVSNNNVVIGENGNENTVVLTWKRTSSNYYDTLIDDAHVYTFGIDLTKLFSDVASEKATQDKMFDHVKFKVQNKTDDYWVKAEYNEAEGVYYVTDHVATEAEATAFTPKTLGGADSTSYGHIMIKGLEDDTYIITEIETANGFTLLKDSIEVVITSADDPTRPCDIYSKDAKGVLQNDPRYKDGNVPLANIPQKQLAHNYLTASATVDGNKVTMLTDRGSENAEVPMSVTNTRGFNPPPTGDKMAMVMIAVGSAMFVSAGAFCVLVFSKKGKKNIKKV